MARDYCPGFSDSGPVAGQISKITFSGNLTTTGESLNFGQIGSGLSASATDCFGTSVSTSGFTFGTSNMSIADINPGTGQVCAGTWNRNTGGGVADYSVCTPPATPPLASTAYITASAGGATSNPIVVYVHPVVTGVTLGTATPTASCSAATSVSGAIATGSNIVTLLPTSGGSFPALTVGQSFSGSGIPAGTTITAINPGSNGTEILTLLYPVGSAPATAVSGILTTGSNLVTLLPPSGGAIPTVTVGQVLSGVGIPTGTTITAVNPGQNGTKLLTLLYPASSAPATTVSGVTTTGSNVVTLLPFSNGVAPVVNVGQVLSGTGIPTGTTITAVNPGSGGTVVLTLLYPATATSTTASPTALTATSLTALTATSLTALTAGVLDPSSNCCPANSSLISASSYDQMSCVSQNQTAQLVARAYSNGDTSAIHNITCQVGHITFNPQSSSSVVSIDANGIATANLPGSTTVLAAVSSSGSGSTAGFFSTCPPKSISLTVAGSATPLGPVSVALNNSQALTTTVIDTAGNTIAGLPLEFVSTSPQTLSAGSNTVTPNFAGTATVTAICQPGSCNPSPFSQIGYLGNGKPVTSNGITVSTSGSSSNQVIVASTNSFFFYSVDFTTGSTGASFKLPYVPNSMVITQDGSTLYLGSTNVLMSVSALTGSATAIAAVPGVVLAVSPDGSTLVIADATRGTTSLYSNSGSLQSTYAGVGTRAQFTPDSQTVYIAAGNLMLVHSSFSGWTSTPVAPNYQDVAIAVPAYGAYFAGGTETDGRSYCPTSTGTAPSSPPPAVVNTFFPQADTDASPTQRVAATADGAHLLGLGVGTAAPNAGPNLYDLALTPASSATDPRLACTTATAPVTFTHTTSVKPLSLPANSTLNGIVPASNSVLAFINYSVPATVTAAGSLPFYLPATKALGSITLSGGATAPVAGAFSSDNKTFYTTTSGDNALHIIAVSGTTATDSSTIQVNLPSATGTGTVTPNLIAQRVKRATS